MNQKRNDYIMNLQPERDERVARERAAHETDDVLARSYLLKEKFCHVRISPTMRRCDKEVERLLSDVKNLRILDLGCGTGQQCLDLLSRGARVDGVDISEVYIEAARSAAKAMQFGEDQWSFCVMDAHNLDFESERFDIVVGSGILHHLDLSSALAEIRRVLKPGGRAIFLEPLGANPLLKLFRMMTPAARTVDERPLSMADLDMIAGSGWQSESSYYGIISAPVAVVTSLLLRPYPDNYLLRMADFIERRINLLQLMRPFNQYVLLNIVRT